jgi:hypothetical protein
MAQELGLNPHKTISSTRLYFSAKAFSLHQETPAVRGPAASVNNQSTCCATTQEKKLNLAEGASEPHPKGP